MLKILFICTHNRCRSILSEAITNYYGQDVLQARSAGSQASGEVHPLSLKYLRERGIKVEGLKSQSWNEFETYSPDIVVTVCNSAAKEVCPIWFGNTLKLHWDLADPSKLIASEREVANAFNQIIDEIIERTDILLTIAKKDLKPNEIHQELLTATS